MAYYWHSSTMLLHTSTGVPPQAPAEYFWTGRLSAYIRFQTPRPSRISTIAKSHSILFLLIRRPWELLPAHTVDNVVFDIKNPTVRLQSQSTPWFVTDHVLTRFKQVVCGTLAGVVLTAAAFRIAFQIKNRRRLYLSDIFLLFSCICLCASTVVLYQFADMLYLEQALSRNLSAVPVPPDFFAEVGTSLKYLYSYQAIMWATVFSVKFSFLCFFRPLVNRLARLKIWWNCVTVSTALSWAFCTADVFIICPHFDLSARKCPRPKCCPRPNFTGGCLVQCANVTINHKAQPVSILVVCLDVLTDFMSTSKRFLEMYCC